MYVLDFLKCVFKKFKISTIIYFLLNIAIISYIVHFLLGGDVVVDCIIGFCLYAVWTALVLSPVGEIFLRFKAGCGRIRNNEIREYIEPLFEEVYSKARKLDSSIPSNVKLFMNKDDDASAYATGRRTICISKGLADMPEDYVKARLAHEFGHLAKKDTDMILLVSMGNIVVAIALLVVKAFVVVAHIMIRAIAKVGTSRDDGPVLLMVEGIFALITFLTVDIIADTWCKLGMLFLNLHQKNMEYSADRFAVELGYVSQLKCLLGGGYSPREDESNKKKRRKKKNKHKRTGLFAILSKNHPRNKKRIKNIEEIEFSTPRYEDTDNTTDAEFNSQDNNIKNEKNVTNVGVSKIQQKLEAIWLSLKAKLEEKGISQKKLALAGATLGVLCIAVVAISVYSKFNSKADEVSQKVNENIGDVNVQDNNQNNINKEDINDEEYKQKWEAERNIELQLIKITDFCALAIRLYDSYDSYKLNDAMFWNSVCYFEKNYLDNNRSILNPYNSYSVDGSRRYSETDIMKFASIFYPQFSGVPNIPEKYAELICYMDIIKEYSIKTSLEYDTNSKIHKYAIMKYVTYENGMIDLTVGKYNDTEDIMRFENLLRDENSYEEIRESMYKIRLVPNSYEECEIEYSIYSVQKLQ